jgi:cation:H+ antiporter
MQILLWATVFVVAMGTLIKAADYFTESAEKIGLHFKLSPFIIGITIVALGTSLPEISTSIMAVIEGKSEIVVTDVVGSNLANILLVLGICAIVAKKELTVTKNIIKVDLPIVLASTIILYITTIDGQFTPLEGIFALSALVTYMVYNAKSKPRQDKKQVEEIADIKIRKARLNPKEPVIVLLSAIVIYFTATWTITAIIELATLFEISEGVISVTALAIGTSLPELVVSARAAMRGKGDMAIGNITGSNVFNILGVMSVPSFIGTLTIPEEMISFGIPALMFVTILYVFESMEKVVTKWEGITLLIIYVLLMIELVTSGAGAH